MNRFIRLGLILVSIIFSFLIIFYVFWPFARSFIDQKVPVGDALFHLANIVFVQRNPVFPLMSWRPEYGGYPLIEGYPMVQNYLIQLFFSHFKSFFAMDYYASFFLLIYYFVSFLLLFYVSRNIFLALLFSLVLIYGADSQLSLSVNAFINFVTCQFLLPLILLLTIIAWKKNSSRLFLLSAIVLAFSFYAHGSLTGYMIIPTILPFIVLNNSGKITKESIFRTIRYFLVFALISTLQIYQFIDYARQGYLNGITMYPLNIIPGRFMELLSWMNPVLLPILIIFIPLFIMAVKKSFSRIMPYVLSLAFITFMFLLGLFNITSLNLILLAVRVLLGVSLSFLLLFAVIIGELTGSNLKKTVMVGAVSLVMGATYLYFTLIVKPPHLIPDVLRASDPYLYHKFTAVENADAKRAMAWVSQFKIKYDVIYSFSPPNWSKSFDNYRTDGLSWAIYTTWPIWSTETRYKGRFPMSKGLPLDWQGLVTAAEYGTLGEAGAKDNSQWAINQSIFFFDWYGIKHFEIGRDDSDLAQFLRKKPLISSTDVGVSHVTGFQDLLYFNADSKYISPIYAPTNAKTIAVISPEKQYDNFIRTVSYSDFTSQKLIPIYLGENLSSLTKENLKYFDAVFLYGYNSGFFGASETWDLLNEYVNNGGNLIIETGQKVGETESFSLPDVFPMQKTDLTVVNSTWNVTVEKNNLTQGVQVSDFNPLKTKYLPYGISETSPSVLKPGAKPILLKDADVVMAYEEHGKGKVVWSGINLPFHAIDNRNTSETVIFANILNWFFPEKEPPIESFKVDYPNPEKIVLSSNEGRGFLVKENFNPGWSATLNGKSVKIYKAGLFQMYVPFDQIGGTQTLVLSYYGNLLHWVLFAVSFISLIGVLLYVLFNKNPLLLVGRHSVSLTKKLPKPDIKSEEEDY